MSSTHTHSLKVLLLTSSYPRNDTDNSSVFLRYLATNLAKQNVDVHVLAPDHPLVDNIELDAGVQNHWFQYLPKQWQRLTYGSGILPNLKRNKLLYLQVPFFLFTMFIFLFFLCRKIRPDVIHAHWILPQGLVAVIVGKLLKIPVIATAHGGDAFSLKTGILSRLKVLTLRRCNVWTSNTLATAKAFGDTNNFPNPTIIPMGVDIEHFQLSDSSKTLGTETRKIILFVGRLVEKKGVKYLIEAFSKLPKDAQENSVLWIIGDGAERKSLETLANNLKITNIKFWGQIHNKQLPNFYTAASLFVAPSIIDSKGDTEGQGVILLEAMSCKTPIIATTVGGIPEVINHKESGLLVEPYNSSQLSSAILSLLNDKQLTKELTDNALRTVVERYSWNAVAQQFISTFNNLRLIRPIHRGGFSTTIDRSKKAKKIITILEAELGTPIENLSILDIGTGSGEIASYLGKKNNVMSVDVTDTRQTYNNFYFSISNETLPFKNQYFDIVISNHVIEHVHDQEQHIDEIKRVLKKAALLYLATPNRMWPYEVHYRLYCLHYLPQKLFIKTLKYLNKYEEDVDLLALKKIQTLFNKDNLTSYSGRIIKNPSNYLMKTPVWLESILNKLPIRLIEKLTAVHPTFVFIYKNKH